MATRGQRSNERATSTRPAAGRSRTNDPEGLRRRVLDAAAALFQAHGYAATGTQEIFASAEVTSGAFYHHFTGKKDLGLAVVRERVAAEVEDTWLAPVRTAKSALDGVTAVFASIAKQLDAKHAVRGCPAGNLAMELAYADPDFQRELKSVYDHWRRVLADKLTEDMAAQRIARGDAGALASYVIAVYSGAMALAKVEQRAQPLHDCLRVLAPLLGKPGRG